MYSAWATNEFSQSPLSLLLLDAFEEMRTSGTMVEDQRPN
jgi:hypothetical protein